MVMASNVEVHPVNPKDQTGERELILFEENGTVKLTFDPFCSSCLQMPKSKMRQMSGSMPSKTVRTPLPTPSILQILVSSDILSQTVQISDSHRRQILSSEPSRTPMSPYTPVTCTLPSSQHSMTVKSTSPPVPS